LKRGVTVYRDDIHLNPQGQPFLADVLAEAVAAAEAAR
jgi:lysophospholipase L1-like esterase